MLPAEGSLDFPPFRRAETPKDWSDQGLQVVLIEARVAVHPSAGFDPGSVLLKLSVVSPSDDIHFLASFPETDFSAIATYNVELASNGRFVHTAVAESKVGGGVSHGPAKVSAEVSDKETRQIEAAESAKIQFEYSPRTIKVVTTAVGETCRWQLLRT